MPPRRGVRINGGLENSSNLNKREVGIDGRGNGGWKILENLINGVGWRKFYLIR